jgi:hypothetical protein
MNHAETFSAAGGAGDLPSLAEPAFTLHSLPASDLTHQLAGLGVLEQYLLEMLDLQCHEPAVQREPDAEALVLRAIDLLAAHTAAIRDCLADGPEVRSVLRAAAASLAGFFAGCFRKSRARAVPAILCHDAFLLAAAEKGYAALCVRFAGERGRRELRLARRHLRELAALTHAFQGLTPPEVVGPGGASATPFLVPSAAPFPLPDLAGAAVAARASA